MDELAVGLYKILEPKQDLRGLAQKKVSPTWTSSWLP